MPECDSPPRIYPRRLFAGRKVLFSMHPQNNQCSEMKSQEDAASVFAYEKNTYALSSSPRHSGRLSSRRECAYWHSVAAIAEDYHRRTSTACHCARTAGCVSIGLRACAGLCASASVCSSSGLCAQTACGVCATVWPSFVPPRLPSCSPPSSPLDVR